MTPVVLGIQRRMMTLGRVRLGEKGPRGEPRKLGAFRFTSASRVLLEAVAAQHGGTVREWAGAPDEGYFEVATDATSLDIILPPVYSDQDGTLTVPYSQWMEHWSAGGCQRRCDGVTESISGTSCLCAPAVEAKGEDARTCKVTTRVSFMLPDIPGLGVWRIDSHGWNAAVELPTTLEVLVAAAREMRFIPAVLRLDQRTKKVPGEGTRKFVVPVIELPNVTVKQLASGEAPNVLAMNVPPALPKRGERAALPAAPVLEQAEAFENGNPPLGEPPDIEQPVTVDRDTQPTALALELSALADGLGARETTEAAILKNRDANADDPDKHVAWLQRQIKTARKNFEANVPEAEQESFFAQAAAEAQRKRGK